MATTFRSVHYPSLTVTRLEGGSLRFAGGVLELEAEEDIQRLRDVAEAYPQYGIEEVSAVEAPPSTETTETSTDSTEDDGDPTNEELREELRQRGLPVSGNKDELLARLAESDES